MGTIFRKDKIIELCTGKSVLHLGFIQHSHLYESLIDKKEWLHAKINEVATELVGIDYLKDDVEIIKHKYNLECYFGDVMNLDLVDLNKTFDVIVCGELIEHVENPGLMLKGIKRFMNEKSILIITTPNPWSSNRIKLLSRNIREEKWLNPEHISWYSYNTLVQLMERMQYNEELYSFYYSEEKRQYFKKSSLGFVKNSIKKIRIRNTRDYNYNGLFFIAKL